VVAQVEAGKTPRQLRSLTRPTVPAPSCTGPAIDRKERGVQASQRADRRTSCGISCRMAQVLWDFVQGGAGTVEQSAHYLWDSSAAHAWDRLTI